MAIVKYHDAQLDVQSILVDIPDVSNAPGAMALHGPHYSAQITDHWNVVARYACHGRPSKSRFLQRPHFALMASPAGMRLTL